VAIDAIELGTRLVSARQRAGMTQRALAESIGVFQTAVSRWELGVTVPTVVQFVEFCELVGADPGAILAAVTV
jgi:transcriptional regulator with XRE-family HTH domain